MHKSDRQKEGPGEENPQQGGDVVIERFRVTGFLESEKIIEILLDKKITKVVLIPHGDEDIPGKGNQQEEGYPPSTYEFFEKSQFPLIEEKKTDDQGGE